MGEDRLLHILTRLVELNPEGGSDHLCQLSAEVAGVTGAGIMLMSDDPFPQGSLCSTDGVSALIEELQFTLGQGPCIDAFRDDQVVSEPDLAGPTSFRWPALCPPLLAAGARALFGFPLRVGGIRMGALNLYQDHPGDLSAAQHADALSLAYVSARVVLSQSGDLDVLGAGPGADFHLVVHQAAGMVSVQLGVSLAEALVRLRARAFAQDTNVDKVADLVVSRTLRFT
ncbi:MAG TPA: GAF and ANTAR domain-containing protein [Candidatus Saccharimonadales bacterium]|nr:GAF and ANTAR domain-containing protein [Candidatus Saccharimonadales bacterium]